MITESDQRTFVFSLKDTQKIQVQGRLRDMTCLVWGSPCCGAQGRAGTPSLCPQSDQALRLWRSEEGSGATDDGSVSFLCRPQASRCAVTWLAPPSSTMFSMTEGPSVQLPAAISLCACAGLKKAAFVLFLLSSLPFSKLLLL